MIDFLLRYKMIGKDYFIWILLLLNLYRVFLQECLDKNSNCLNMKKKGWCEYRKDITKVNCKKTCGFCVEVLPLTSEVNSLKTEETVVTQVNIDPNVDSKAQECSNVYDFKKCAYFKHMGWCERNVVIKVNCKKTCGCEFETSEITCQSSKHGCCNDKKTVRTNEVGSECPDACKDDAAYAVICKRFSAECNGQPGALTTSVKRYCRKTCNLC